jgi:hypothetical protein
MRAITFTFGNQVPRQQQNVALQQIRALPGVQAADYVQPDSTDVDIGRIAYVYASDDVDEATILERLNALPEIESTEIPPTRFLR